MRFTDVELQAEWAREAVLCGLAGSWEAGRRCAVLARFLLLPGIEKGAAGGFPKPPTHC